MQLDVAAIVAGILYVFENVSPSVVANVNNANNANTAVQFANGNALRVMPLGASITFGTNSASGNGYRKFLRDRLSGVDQVAMIGEVQNGDMCNNNVEAWPGLLIDEIASKSKALVAAQKPNVVLVLAGTNDCVQNKDFNNIGNRLNGLLDGVFAASPDTTVVLSTLLHHGRADVNARVVQANAQYKQIVATRQGSGQKIVLADMYTDNPDDTTKPSSTDITDGTHPNDNGYRKMADIWFSAIQQTSTSHWISKAVDVGLAMPKC